MGLGSCLLSGAGVLLRTGKWEQPGPTGKELSSPVCRREALGQGQEPISGIEGQGKEGAPGPARGRGAGGSEAWLREGSRWGRGEARGSQAELGPGWDLSQDPRTCHADKNARVTQPTGRRP